MICWKENKNHRSKLILQLFVFIYHYVFAGVDSCAFYFDGVFIICAIQLLRLYLADTKDLHPLQDTKC